MKKREGKFILKLVGFILICYVLGYATGHIIAIITHSSSIEQIKRAVVEDVVNAAPFVYMLFALVTIVTIIYQYSECRKMYKLVKEKGYDENALDHLEEKLNHPMILSNIMLIASLFFFSCIICMVEYAAYGKESIFERAVLIGVIVFIIASFIVCLVVQRGIVEIEKGLNPEKEGNIFDSKFNDIWLESCDEAEKLTIYKASYRAFQNVNLTCIILWGVCFISIFVCKTGIFPVLLICIIWMVNILSYMITASKLEKKF